MHESSTTWPAIQPHGRFSSECAKPWTGSREDHSCLNDSIADDLTRRRVITTVIEATNFLNVCPQ